MQTVAVRILAKSYRRINTSLSMNQLIHLEDGQKHCKNDAHHE
jgi:hypothetical protein